MEEAKAETLHGLTLQNRARGRVTGVQDICSFDENEITLLTEAGKMLIKGEQLHVKSLDLTKGEAELEGKVSSILYPGKNIQKKNESWIKRMLR